MHAYFPRLGLVALLLALAQTLLAGAPAGLPETASASLSGSLTLVQAVPGRTVDIRIDGRPVRRAVDVGDVVGPVQLSAGRHTDHVRRRPGRPGQHLGAGARGWRPGTWSCTVRRPGPGNPW